MIPDIEQTCGEKIKKRVVGKTRGSEKRMKKKRGGPKLFKRPELLRVTTVGMKEKLEKSV